MTPRPHIPRRRLGPLARLLSVSALGVLTVGCAASGPSPSLDLASVTPNPIRISRTQLAHDVDFVPGAITADDVQMTKVYGFLAANRAGPADDVLVEYGRGAFEAQRGERLTLGLDQVGLHANPVENDAVVGDVVRIVVQRYLAIAPDCPDWSQPPAPDFNNLTSHNFGCADQSNLAAQVANPRDLAQGQDLAPQKGDAATRPVTAYRTGGAGVARGAVGAPPGTGGGMGAAGAGAGAGMGASGGP